MQVVVETQQGRIRGEQADGLCAFRGVPFARPPVGALRFRAPQRPEPWAGVRDARGFGASAPQTKLRFDLFAGGMDVGEQSEDCLFLNVFTPAADDARRPVLVWIHGGAFTIGSGSQSMYDVRPLARRGDAVLVSINYRLGALGFLHLADAPGERSDTSANAGILDQVCALEWVRENIAAFGGDPERVTIFGESAGGMSVGTLLGMPRAQGLFRGAIAQSGAAHRVNDREQAGAVAAALLGHLGLSPQRGEALWEVPVPALLEAQARVIADFERESARRAFCPTVDGRSLPDPPIDAIRRGLSRDVALIAGTTRDEWRLFGFMDPQAAKLDEAELVARMEARVPGHGRSLVDAYRAARPGASAPDLYFALETDRVFRIPAIRLAEAQAAHRPSVWSYLMSWESPAAGGALGACHGVDVPFVMGAIGTPAADFFAGGGPEAETLSARVMDAWLAFARSGDPGHARLPAWPGYRADRRDTMILDRTCRVERSPFDAERAAWDGL